MGLFFMININGNLVENRDDLILYNRGYKYGDALFETMKVFNGNILFLEDHYFRLMASMRILRMEIPMTFTMEFIESEILKTIGANNLDGKHARVRFNVDRTGGGKYKPTHKEVNFNIEVEALENGLYAIDQSQTIVIDLYKDFFVAEGLLSSLKSNNKAINVLGSIFAEDNGYDNCLLLNTKKQVVEALNGNLFLLNGETIRTPPIEDGCIKGIMRGQILEIIAKQLFDYKIEQSSISPFELQKADELFITNVITGIQPITDYRKKTYKKDFSNQLVKLINEKISKI